MRRKKGATISILVLTVVSALPAPAIFAQAAVEPLDPARAVSAPELESGIHQALPEQYIWTSEDSIHGNLISYKRMGRNEQIAPHYFRRTFHLDAAPSAATLYIAGPRSVRAFLNGRLVERVESNLDSPLGIHVYAQDVTAALRSGDNTLAIEAVRGRGVNGFNNSALTMQLTRGEILAVKIVPALPGVDAPSLVAGGPEWRGSLTATPGWQNVVFDDGGWKPVQSLGSIEGSIDLLQWNADAGLYDWPGYDGVSPFLARMPLPPVSVGHAYAGAGAFHNLAALTQTSETGAAPFTVELPSDRVEDQSAPQILLDFGREINGRLQFVSSSDQPARVTVQYGESEAETLSDPYLGINPLSIPAHGVGYGPKSAFRYALIRFIGGKTLLFPSIRADVIYYPVRYQGSFESSDAALNRMWEVGAYTAHLCMQDDVWDAPKRDRGRWMGDLDVSGRTINDVFADRFLMEDTLDRLMGPAPVEQHVNGIAGYSAFWITGEAEYYRHIGSKQQLESFHPRLIQLMSFMERELDARHLYANRTKAWPFVDWSPELNGDTPEALRATQFEFYAAFEQGVYLLREMGDTENARLFEREARQMKTAAQQYLLDKATDSFGTRWQTNAIAVLSGAADPAQYGPIWKASLAGVGKIKYNALIVTPYYNYYVISAMAKMGHRAQALDWIRQYWGGMIQEGATSFWEGYDPSWYKGDFHASLQADNGSGYYVSLAHGWSTGVTPWLMEEVLGIHATGAGFSTVEIRPDLIDLAWAKGGEPTPRGMLNVSIRKAGAGVELGIDLPPGTEARVSAPVENASREILVNGTPETAVAAENGRRAIVTLNQSGHFDITTR